MDDDACMLCILMERVCSCVSYGEVWPDEERLNHPPMDHDACVLVRRVLISAGLPSALDLRILLSVAVFGRECRACGDGIH